MSPAIDFSNVKGLEPLPVGVYTATIVEAEAVKSKAGNDMINLRWKVSGGKYDGRIIFDSLVFSEKTMFRVKNALLGLGFSKTYKGDIDPDTLIGKSASLVVEIEDQTQTDPDTGEPYPPRNRVRKIKPLTAPAPAAPAAKK